jgi:Holliday junction resolvasome RuvABC endonuclease subunit
MPAIFILPTFENTMSNLPTILSIDLGTHTGWALQHADGQITSGTAHFPLRKGDGNGMRYLRFRSWLKAMLESPEKIDAVYFEAVYRHDGTYAAHVYGGLLSHVSELCERYRIPYFGVPVGTIKLFISGRGNASKEDVIRSLKTIGHNPTDDNEADALALLYFAMHRTGKVHSTNLIKQHGQ